MIPFPELGSFINEFIIVIFGGIVGAVFTYCVGWVRHKRMELRFPVSGEYISFFEDIHEGKTIVVPSESTVKQNGRSLKIVTNLKDGRSWSLDGSILEGGHISGVYSADAIYDDGVGSFYLRVEGDSLNGMWNGYDSVNKMINSGRYWFNKKLEADIRKSNADDINDILHTSGNSFGNGYIEGANIKNSDRDYSIVATVDDEFAGFSLGFMAGEGEFRELIRNHRGVLPDDVKFAVRNGNLGVVKTVVVRRKFRKRGVGMSLFKASEAELKKRGAECIVVPAWSREGVMDLAGVLRQEDYVEWFADEAYWKSDCDLGRFQCLVREGECVCSAVFYKKGRV